MYSNLIEILSTKINTENRGIYFIRSEEKEEYLSYGELYRLAWQQKECMLEKGMKSGTEVILQYEDNRAFLIAFWACILGKMIPVPQAAKRGKESIEHVLKIYQLLRNPYIATTNSRRKEITQFSKEDNERELRFFEQSGEGEEYKFTEQTITCNPDDIAFLQFSSGSTGDPKGIKVSHKNLIENFNGMVKSSEIRETDSMLSWMPLYHNLGLIVSHMLGIVCSLDSYIMSTELFIYQPYLWMEKISEHKVTLTCSPNFGYRYYLRGIMNRDCSELDLSHLRIILNGAEPISLKACNTFLEMMKPYGLSENVFQTGYGLAEATVSVTSTYVGKSLENVWISGENHGVGKKVQFLGSENDGSFVIELVKVGRPHFNIRIRVVDEERVPLEEDYFGEIQVNGPIVSCGYYEGLNQEEKMELHDGWLGTGDIGFIHKGELFISGRKKDIIFVNGKNYYCHDLEGIIKEEYPNCECAICGIYQKEEERDQIILFLVKGDQTFIELRKFGACLKKRIAKRTGIILDKVVTVNEIPKTTSGKIQRFQLKEYISKGLYYNLYQQYSRAQVIDIIEEQLNKVLGFTMDDLDESIVEAGVNSMKAAQFHKLMSQVFEVELPVSIVYDYPSVNAIANFILGEKEEEHEKQERKEIFQTEDIAVIGMACQFPKGADTKELYWSKLLEGYNGITDIPEERMQLKEYCKKNRLDLKGGFLSDIEQFDAGLFGITPKEAKYLDPQQRLLLKNTYLALQDAYLDIKELRGSRTGVYIGISNSDYKEIMPKEETVSYMLSGNMNNMAAGRISYTFDFHGPSLVVDTACSSSLVAVHQAVLSIRSGESDMALAGGVNCILSPYGYLGLKEMNALSPTGYCHTFDERADGYVRSEGCGVVVLKRYRDAIENGDRIYAVIKGSAVNSDGWSSGLTAPNGTAQVRVMRQALKNAGVMASEVSFVETHGTGTKLGDPQEMNALNLVYGARERQLYLGAGKTNIGHAESAAGIAAFIKTVLAVYYGKIPGNRGIHMLNHLIPWQSMKFQVPTTMVEWKEPCRMAGISSFGLSGTNAHVIVGQAEQLKHYAFPKSVPQILTLSARKKDLLVKEIEDMADFLEETADPLELIIFTANRCRAGEKYKAAVAARTREEYIKRLREKSKAVENSTLDIIPKNKKIMLLCGGIQKLNLEGFHNLYEKNFIFQEAVKECEEILMKEYDVDVKAYLHGEGKDNPFRKMYLDMTTEYGIVKTIQYFGIKINAILGHSYGEWIGAVAAGILSLKQAFSFATVTEQIKEKYGKKLNTALVFLSEEKWMEMQDKEKHTGIHLLTVNTKESLVVGYEELSKFQSFVNEHDISYLELLDCDVNWIEDKEAAVQEFCKFMSKEEFQDEVIPYYSTARSFGKHTVNETRKMFVWLLEQDVHILRAIQKTEELDCDIYVECNVRPYLLALAEQDLKEEKSMLPIMRKAGDEELQLRDAIRQLYEYGVEVDFSVKNVQGDWLIQLPGKEWKQSNYWF